MAFLVGTDEAGYGPNLGPLVISASLWETPDDVGTENLFARLAHVISPTVQGLSSNGGPCVAMADSKALYSPDKGLRHLERGVWAALGLLNHRPQSWRDVWLALAPEVFEPMARTPWYTEYDGSAPIDCDGEDFDPLSQRLRVGLAAVGVRLLRVRSRVVFADEFNALVDQHGSKGAALSHETLALAARMIDPLPTGPIAMVCDKHGGRNRYGALLAQHFPEWLVEVRGEGRERSSYRFGPAERRIEVCFRTKAESCLPAALASMASKYLRELAMRAFNHYWCCRVPGLKPTAGYPDDAKRFRMEIAETQLKLRIDDRILWRTR
jgi:hypothetical protein